MQAGPMSGQEDGGFAFRSSGGVATPCACDSGFAWQKQGRHPCGCDLGSEMVREDNACASCVPGINGGGNDNGENASAAPSFPCTPKCGKNIDGAFERMSKALDTFFGTLSEAEKQDICGGDPLLPAYYNRGNGWDICELAWNKKKFCSRREESKCCEGCGDSVMIGGRCWPPHYVNYWLWGRMHRQCSNLLDTAAIAVHRYLHVVRGDAEPGEGTEVGGRVCWAVTGFQGYLRPDLVRRSQYHGRRRRFTKREPECYNLYQLNCESCGVDYDGELTVRIRAHGDIMYSIRHGRATRRIAVTSLQNPNAPVENCEL